LKYTSGDKGAGSKGGPISQTVAMLKTASGNYQITGYVKVGAGNISKKGTVALFLIAKDSNGKSLKSYTGKTLQRLATDKFSANSPRPKVWMFTYGNLTMRKARSQFAANFFGCAGFETIDNLGFETIDDGIKAAKDEKPEIVVICSSDEEYSEIALPIFEALKEEAIVVLAGYPKELVEKFKSEGLTNFIHAKSNVLKELTMYQKELGVV